MGAYSYNGVALEYWRTSEFAVEPEYDPSGTDVIYMKYTIKGVGFVSTTSGDISNPTPLVLSRIQEQLTTPRASMSYEIGGTTLIQIDPGTIDDKLGPHPFPARVSGPTSGYFLVECGCVVRLNKCAPCPDGSSATPVVSNRWTTTETFDENWYSRITTKGLLIVRSSLLQSADNFRVQTAPPIYQNYKRLGATYTLSPDGLQLEYTYEDQEVDRLPPSGDGRTVITSAEGTYKVEVAAGASKRVGTVDLTLVASAGGSRQFLLARAVSMAYAKLKQDALESAKPGQQPSTPPILSGFVSEDLFVPKVRITMTAIMNPLTGPGFGRPPGTLSGANANQLGVMPSCGQTGYQYSGLSQSQPGLSVPQRKAVAGLLTAMFLDPCACVTAGSEATLSSSGSQSLSGGNTTILSGTAATLVGAGVAPATINIGTVGTGTISATVYVSDTAPYTEYYIEGKTQFHSGLVQQPGTGVGPQGGVSSIASASGGSMQLLTWWSAERMGVPPVAPTYESPDPNIVPLEGEISYQGVTPSADMNAVRYVMSGYYIYAILDPSLFDITAPVPPWLGPAFLAAADDAAQLYSDVPVWGPTETAAGGQMPFELGGIAAGLFGQTPLGFGNDESGAPAGVSNQNSAANSGQGAGGQNSNIGP